MRILIAAALLAVPGTLAAAPQAGDHQTNAAAGESSEVHGDGSDKVICKREKVLGSRLSGKKVCQTAAEWERQRREDQQLAEKVQSMRSKSD